MQLFELIDFHCKYGKGGVVNLKLLHSLGRDKEQVVRFDGNTADLGMYTQFLGYTVIENRVDLITSYGFYRLVVVIDCDPEAV